ncbi:hypothetical protein [Microtetraspora niveoalba]|uniref:hypothetical protein n=1 Tax=Microtetraspora niveoalba TaxID=46175 RepID=UPI00082DDEE4|nr:hypothetical protein [Microtetraspora niveoalba]
MKIRLLAATAPLALVLAACGGSGAASSGDDGIASAGGGSAATPGASASATLDPQEAGLKFAQCMREHGVDMPDPSADGGVRIQVPKGMDKGKVDAAMKECQPIMEKSGIGARAKDPEVIDRLVKFARCMREHGVDVPDPVDGLIEIKHEKADESKIKEAQEACSKLAPRPGGGK